ncbi:MAG: hypothetical protein ACLQCU_10980 [Acidimicrobiales bacterium]
MSSTWSGPVVSRDDCVTVAAFHAELVGDLRLHECFSLAIEGG